MPQLGIPALAAVGGGTATTTTVVGGLTAAELALLGIAAVTVATISVIGVKGIIDDYLDGVEESEIDGVLTQAGDRSRVEQATLQDCADCIWSLVNIQAQGRYVEPRSGRAPTQGAGPYLVQGRTVFVREGIVLAGAAHEFSQGVASSRQFRDIVRWGILAKTIAFIQSRPPAGLSPTDPRSRDFRPGRLDQYTSDIRYDIMVNGTINAFMA